MNWILFILIFASLLFRPNVKKETSNNGNLRKLKENFMIALGLSLLFGMGWAIGLLATSDLPPGVRYPAEWVFTLTTAFLGVYLFILYVVRSHEARKFWRKWICPCVKEKEGAPSTSTNNPSGKRWGTISSTLRSWGGTLKFNKLRRSSKDTNALNSTLTQNPSTSSANLYSLTSTAGRMVDINSSYAEPSSVTENTAGVSPTYMPPVEIELVRRADPDGQSNNEEDSPKPLSPSELPVKVDMESESVMETMSFHDNFSLLSYNAFSTQSDTSLTGTGDHYIVENKETEGSDIIPL